MALPGTQACIPSNTGPASIVCRTLHVQYMHAFVDTNRSLHPPIVSWPVPNTSGQIAASLAFVHTSVFNQRRLYTAGMQNQIVSFCCSYAHHSAEPSKRKYHFAAEQGRLLWEFTIVQVAPDSSWRWLICTCCVMVPCPDRW